MCRGRRTAQGLLSSRLGLAASSSAQLPDQLRAGHWPAIPAVQSSIQTYVANLKRLGNMLNLTKYKDLGFLKDTDRVMAAPGRLFLIFLYCRRKDAACPPPLYHHYITSI